MSRVAPLTIFERRSLFLVTSEVCGPVQSWPVQGESFSLLVSTHGSVGPSAEALYEFAKDALAAGAKWAVCAGPWADDMEEAILNAQGEQEQAGEAPAWRDVLVSAIVESPIAEATWQAWNLFNVGDSPVVAVFFEGDPCLEPFKALARDLQSTFAEVLEADSEAS